MRYCLLLRMAIFSLLVTGVVHAAIPVTQPSTKPTIISSDTHTGYFVSNQFEPEAPVSFVVIRDQKAFDAVFGTAMVMRDRSHRLPANAFDIQIVVAAIKRGKAVVEFTVKEVVEERGVLILRYTTAETRNDTANFSCPLIVSVPRGDYAAVEFQEDGKNVKTIELKGAASQPTVKFLIRSDKQADTVAVITEADRTIFTIASLRGIGGANIERKGDSWPKQLLLRVHLHGLESFTIACGDRKLAASVASHSGFPRSLTINEEGKNEAAVAKDSPYWMDIAALDAKGIPVNDLPEKDGYFEMVIPTALLDETASKITISWIDFYR